MSYLALRFDVEAAAGDAWSDALLEAGALSVDAADSSAGTAEEMSLYAEGDDGQPQWWPISRLTALLDGDRDSAAIVSRAAATLALPVPQYDTFIVADQDWVRATQAQFHPIRIVDDLWIVPSWCAPPCPDALNVTLDPGLAFGTGAHPTTRLCLAWLRAQVRPGMSVLDYGCGSGILAITAAKLGATDVVGTDIDPQAVRASVDNARANDAAAAFVPVAAVPRTTFDIVVANILATPLRVLAPALAARTAAHGHIALAGILASQADDVIEAYAPWFAIVTRASAGDWVLLVGQRLADQVPGQDE